MPLSLDLAKSQASCLTWQSIVPISAVASSPLGLPPAGDDCGMGIAPAQSAVIAHSTAKAFLFFLLRRFPLLSPRILERRDRRTIGAENAAPRRDGQFFFFVLRTNIYTMRASVALVLLHAAACECMAKLEKGTPALPAFALSSTAQLQASLPMPSHHACTDRIPNPKT